MRNVTRTLRAPRAGFTLVEAIISAGLVALLATSAMMASSEGYGAFKSTRQNSAVESKVRHAIDRVAQELVSTGQEVVFPTPVGQFGTSDLVFQQAQGMDESAIPSIEWSDPIRLAFEYEAGEIDDGVDNNGNGLVDEGVLVLTRDDGGPDEKRVVLCRGVRELLEGEVGNGIDDNGNGLIDERGFNVHQEGAMLFVRLTVEEPSAQAGTIMRTLTTSVRLRN